MNLRHAPALLVVGCLVVGCDVDDFLPTVHVSGWEQVEDALVVHAEVQDTYRPVPTGAWTLVTWPEMTPMPAAVTAAEGDDGSDRYRIEAHGIEHRWYAVMLAPEEAPALEPLSGWRLADDAHVWVHDSGYVAEPERVDVPRPLPTRSSC